MNLSNSGPPHGFFSSTQIIKNHNFSQKMIFSLLGLLAGAAIGALVTVVACTDTVGSQLIL